MIESARGLFIGTCCGAALICFTTGAAFAATGSENIGAWLMVAACICSVFATAAGWRAP